MNDLFRDIKKIVSCHNQKSIGILVQENKTLKSILDNLTEGVIVADQIGKFVYFNPTAEHILGIGPVDASVVEWSSIYGTYYPDKISPYPSKQLPLARALRGETIIDELMFIQNFHRQEGIFIEVSASPMKDSAGSIIGGIVILRDVTSIKQAEMRQRQSDQRIVAQFKGFPMPTYVWQHHDNDFFLVDFNHAAKDYTRGKIQDFLNKNMRDIFKDEPKIQEDFFRCFKTKKPVNREINSFSLRTTHESKDIIFSYVFVPPDLVMLYLQDVTDQKRNLESLRMLSNAVQQTADSVFITNKQGIIEYVNPAFETTTGYHRDEALGQTPKLLQSGQHDHAFYQNLWKTILSGKPYRGTIINRKKNGQLYWSEQSITPMKDEAGMITHFVSVLKDITDLKEKQEQEFQLRIARELQQRYYHVKANLPGVDIAGATYSAVETNGDYFDFIPMKDGSVAMVIGDVSGHGISAALIMTQTRAYLRAFATMTTDPGELLTKLNQQLSSDLDNERFVTLFLALINAERACLIYANAGHLPGYLLDSAGNIRLMLESNGIPLGIVQDYHYTSSRAIPIVPGEIAFFITDGISEAQASDDSEFTEQRVVEIIRTHRHLNARQIIKHLQHAVRCFVHPQVQQDDMTTIICKINSISGGIRGSHS
ncbi:MAG: SpoIIE family protein phosphatase [candidate division KSB1 bacterium]|nr:SpoIIE family protein phosphatase [candidate division KSB1 bacterium]MDZ7334613.1 SpoIIE family protein phosphatase [candidate division KSB1 bacterium]MDZ7356579.1 SpoIIE family protein phosphatase [candidate division KSB1 bacterium]